MVKLEEKGVGRELVAFFDSGSHRSYILKEEVNKLKLPVIRKEEFELTSFGDDGPREIKADVVLLEIRSERGILKLELTVIPSIISRPTTMVLTKERYSGEELL